jgi:alkanesulfonate monooxygenase SsuD/methylene tetrahydromethanopterin reductase-like flavin-dependent oxidoreductase (luciferase family)
MQLGVQVTGPYDHVARVAGICERAGIAAVALADHYLYGRSAEEYAAPVYDSLVQTAALARDTDAIEIVMLVSPITFRHPAVYAKTITTVDEISDGRFVFGLGTGWHDGEHDVFGFEYPPIGTRFDWLEDALGYLRVFLDDPTLGYEGTRWSLEPLDVHPRARADLRLLVGGGGASRTPSLVGRFADEYNLYHHTSEGIEERLDVMRTAAAAAGRDPDTILISTCLPMIGGADDREIDEFIGDFAAARGLDTDQVRATFKGRIPMRTWDDHAEQLAEFDRLGFERVYLQVVGGVAWSVDNALQALTG